MLDKVATPRNEALGIVTVPAHFEALGFEETLATYMAHLNEKRPQRGKPLQIHEFVRKVNHCPYVDTVLKQRYSEHTIPEGVDGMMVACREVMIATLERYVTPNVAAMMPEKTKDQIAEAIVNSCPELYLNARLASPRRLLNHWMKHPTYSSGVPFIATGLRTRRDVRKAGWFKALESLATLPLREGVWLPSIAHVFPKSQVVELEKLRRDPAKLRSVTATSIVSNLQKGIFNFDVNNRHNWQEAPGKPGIPLTGAHMGKIFEALDGYRQKFSADCTKMDSNLPDLVFDIEARIRKMGYTNHPMYETICTHIDAMMKHTQNGFLINLITEPLASLNRKLDEYHQRIFNSIPEEGWRVANAAMRKANATAYQCAPGGVVTKERGGYTGDSDTTWTNTVGLQIMLFAVVTDLYSIEPDKLLDSIYLANLGDDNVLGVNIEGFDPIAAQRRFKEMFNIEIRFEGEGSTLDQSFLGKVPRPGIEFEADFRLIGKPVPKYAILHDSAKLLMRYTNFKTDSLRYFRGRGPYANDRKFKYLAEKGLGYLSLTAHQQGLYEDLRRRIEADLSQIKNPRLKASVKIPSYHAILTAWYKDRTVGHSQLVQLQINEGFAARAERGMIAAMRGLEAFAGNLPVELFGLEHEAVMSCDLAIASEFIFEDHTWHGIVERTGIEPTAEDLDLALRQTPYYVFCSARRYVEEIAPGNPIKGAVYAWNRAVAQQRVFLYSAIYLATNKVVGLLAFVPFGNVLIAAFNMYTRSLPRLYQFANYLSYLDTGVSNASISRLIPKDVYYNHKAIALTVMRFIPRGISGFPIGLRPVLQVGRLVAEKVSKLMLFTLGSPPRAMTSGIESVPKAWKDAVTRSLDVLAGGKSPIIVAPTGTGKTRWFPRCLLGQELNGSGIERVIVLMPRKILCEQVADHYFHKRRGNLWPEWGLVTCTYGHFAALHMNGQLPFNNSTVVVLDECHEKQAEVLYVRKVVTALCSCVLMTATPSDEDPRYTEVVKVDAKPPWPVDCFEAHGYNPVELFMEVVSPNDRCLIIEPRKRACEGIWRTLTNLGVKAAVVHATQRVVPPDLATHIVATSIVDAGINIEGITVVIDTGTALIDVDGDLTAVYADRVTSIQRKGRTGRFCAGRYFRLAPIGKQSPRPVASIDQVLGGTPLSKVTPVQNQLRVAPQGQQLIKNRHARFKGKVSPRLLTSISVFHALALTTDQPCALYKRLKAGYLEDRTEYITQTFKIIPEDLDDVQLVLAALKDHPIEYGMGGRWFKAMPYISKARVCLLDQPIPPNFRKVPGWEKEGRKMVPFSF